MKLTHTLFTLRTVISVAVASVAQQVFAATTDGPVQVAGNTAGQTGAPVWINYILIGGIMVFMYFFVFRPQSKKAKEQKEFINSLTPGIEVITAGGMIGTIVEVQDTIVSLNVGNGTIKVLKSSISGKLNATTEVSKPV